MTIHLSLLTVYTFLNEIVGIKMRNRERNREGEKRRVREKKTEREARREDTFHRIPNTFSSYRLQNE